MIWTRRAFLETILAATATMVLPGIPGVRHVVIEPPSVLPFDPHQPFWITEFIASAAEAHIESMPLLTPLTDTQIEVEMAREALDFERLPSETPRVVRFSRDGNPIWMTAFHPRSFLRWIATPGGEWYGPGLVNDSDDDLEVEFAVLQGSRRYWIDKDGAATPFDLLPRAEGSDA